MKTVNHVLILCLFALALPLEVVVAEDASPEQKVAPMPYSLPWQLRPAFVGNAIRLDAATGSYSDSKGNTDGSGPASVLTASHKFSPEWGGIFKIGMVDNHPPGTTPPGTSYTNPLIGAAYTQKLTPEITTTYY